MRTILPREKYKEPQQRDNFYQQVLQRVEHLPGVVSAGYSTSVPLAWKGGTSGFYPEGLKSPIPGMAYDANHRQVSADYLKTMNIPLRQGRYFRQPRQRAIDSGCDHQRNDGATVLAWRERASAVASRFGDPDDPTSRGLRLSVSLADVRQMGLDEPVKAEMYLPYQQIERTSGTYRATSRFARPAKRRTSLVQCDR